MACRRCHDRHRRAPPAPVRSVLRRRMRCVREDGGGDSARARRASPAARAHAALSSGVPAERGSHSSDPGQGWPTCSGASWAPGTAPGQGSPHGWRATRAGCPRWGWPSPHRGRAGSSAFGPGIPNPRRFPTARRPGGDASLGRLGAVTSAIGHPYQTPGRFTDPLHSLPAKVRHCLMATLY